MAARAIFLSGPVSAGKTSVGRALQALSRESWLLYEVDRCQPTVPSHGFATLANDRALRRANLEAARAYVHAGFPTIIEMDVADRWTRATLAEVFAGMSAATIVLVCERAAVERRTRERGDRFLDYALAYSDSLDWKNVPADLHLVTDARSPTDLASEILGWLAGEAGP